MSGAQRVEGQTRSFQAGGALEQWARVKLSAGKLALAGAADTDWLGWVTREVFAADEWVAVLLRGTSGTAIGVCSAAIAVGDEIELAASGRSAPFAAGTKHGIALTATNNAAEYFEFVPH